MANLRPGKYRTHDLNATYNGYPVYAARCGDELHQAPNNKQLAVATGQQTSVKNKRLLDPFTLADPKYDVYAVHPCKTFVPEKHLAGALGVQHAGYPVLFEGCNECDVVLPPCECPACGACIDPLNPVPVHYPCEQFITVSGITDGGTARCSRANGENIRLRNIPFTSECSYDAYMESDGSIIWTLEVFRDASERLVGRLRLRDISVAPTRTLLLYERTGWSCQNQNVVNLISNFSCGAAPSAITIRPGVLDCIAEMPGQCPCGFIPWVDVRAFATAGPPCGDRGCTPLLRSILGRWNRLLPIQGNPCSFEYTAPEEILIDCPELEFGEVSASLRITAENVYYPPGYPDRTESWAYEFWLEIGSTSYGLASYYALLDEKGQVCQSDSPQGGGGGLCINWPLRLAVNWGPTPPP